MLDNTFIIISELTEEVEKEFYRTLASLKAKDPKIYDTNTKFFDTEEKGETSEKKKEMII